MRKKPINKDYGRRHYVSDDDYQTAMRRVPDKAVYNENIVKQSEFKKPYRKDSDTYEEMEYHYPDFNFPDLDWPQPNTDVEGIVPGTDLYDYGLVHCFFDLCYCKGQTKCFDYWCTYPLIKAWFDDPRMGISFSGNQICITAPATGVFGSQTLWYDLQLLRMEKKIRKTSISHLYKDVPECNSSECCGCTGISIGYTTQQMAINTQQTLTVTGAVAGCTYNWAIASGGGSLSSNTGISVVYTAPATNPNCNSNPTITLNVGGAQCDILQIAVNAVNDDAYRKPTGTGITYEAYPCPPKDCACSPFWDIYQCNDSYDSTRDPWDFPSCACNGYYTYFCWDGSSCTPNPPCPEIVDLRSDALKAAGCCPAALL